MTAMICEHAKWRAIHNLEPGGDGPPPLYVIGCVQFSESGWNAGLEEGPSLGIVGRNYAITLDLTIFESGPHEPTPNVVEVRWDTTEPPPVDKVLVRSSLLSELLVLIPSNPE